MRSGVRETASRVRVSDSPNVGACNFRCLVGGCSGRGQVHELRHGPERAAAEYGLHGRLADVPVSGPEKAHSTVDRVDRSPAGFEQQGLKQSRSLIFWNVGNEGHEVSTAKEFGNEDSGMALSFGGFDPLQTRTQHTGFATSLSKNSAAVATHAYFATN